MADRGEAGIVRRTRGSPGQLAADWPPVDPVLHAPHKGTRKTVRRRRG